MNVEAEEQPKERILSHVEQRFLRDGFNKVTLDEISGELGISKKTMYKFFPSKEELVKTMMRTVMKRMEKRVAEICESEQPALRKLAELMLFVGKFAGNISRAYQSDIQRFLPSLWKEIDAFRNEKIFSRVGMMIRETKNEGKFRSDVSDEVVVMMFIGSVQSIVNPEVLSRHSFSPKEAMYTIFHVIFEGSLTDEARKEFLNYEITIP